MKYVFILLLCYSYGSAQPITTETYHEQRWVLTTSINLPATKFHLANKAANPDAKGQLELFSAVGVGLSMNYGRTIFTKDVDKNKIIESETKFNNLIGTQVGILYSSKIDAFNQANINDFSMYAAVNILDLQFGFGYELGVKHHETSGWFVSVSYGIPIDKISPNAFYIFPKRKSKPKGEAQEDPAIYASR